LKGHKVFLLWSCHPVKDILQYVNVANKQFV